MKKVMFVFALCASVILVNAQDQKAPKVSTTAPTTQTAPTAPAGKVTNAKVNHGKVFVNENDLLLPIKANIGKDFAGAKINGAFKTEVKGVTNYEVYVTTKENLTWTLTYDKDGKFIKKEEMKKPETKTTNKKEAAPKK